MKLKQAFDDVYGESSPLNLAGKIFFGIPLFLIALTFSSFFKGQP